MSKIESNAVEPQCGTTLTVGASGDTVSLPSGTTLSSAGTVNFSSATQTGVGRQGTVDWEPTPQAGDFGAVSGKGYFVDTSAAARTVTLPSSPSALDIVAIADYAGTAATNSITIARNGSNIEGIADNATLTVNREARTFIYVDGTQGWVPVNTNDSAAVDPAFVTASGGTESTCGNFKIHTFTGPGTFTVSCAGNSVGSNTVDYLVVAGGGGTVSGGGGGGGFRLSNSTCMPAPLTSPLASPSGLPVSAQAYSIAVGGGGAGTGSPPGPDNQASAGAVSTFSTITSAGGGQGQNNDRTTAAGSGGSGGGGGRTSSTISPGGSGNTPPVSPPQGNDGGTSQNTGPKYAGAGGGGAGAAGTSTPGATDAPGGIGSFVVSSGFAGSNGTTGPVSNTRYFSGGGGGGASPGGGSGGAGGGADGNASTGNAATANTGGGGGGSGGTSSGANGGSGIVIIRYKFQ
jgi:hypothetical protein